MHVAYGIGAAVGPEGAAPGLRHQLDLAALIGSEEVISSGMGNGIVGSIDPRRGPLFGASAALGFGAYPTYVLADAGYGTSVFFAAFGSFFEVGARVAPSVAPTLGLRANADFLLANIGVRLLGSVERRPELALSLIVGIGRY
jgi:hypothetical protein